MVNVLFVCLGNICRSPMAEAIFRHEVKQAAWNRRLPSIPQVREIGILASRPTKARERYWMNAAFHMKACWADK